MEIPTLNNLSLHWLDTSLQSSFTHLLKKECESILTNQTPTIPINTTEPLSFIAKIFSNIFHNKNTLICNPQWNQEESLIINKLCNLDIHQPEPLILIPTGGSGKKIKLATHTWSTLTASAKGTQSFLKTPITQHISLLPIYHISGLMPFIRAYCTQSTYSYFNPKNLLSKKPIPILRPETSVLSLVPPILFQLLQSNDWISWLQSFHAIFIGGGPIPQNLIQSAKKHSIPLLKTYGMTETASMVTLEQLNSTCKDPLCVGYPLPHTTIYANQSTPSTISIQTTSLFKGYYPDYSNNIESFSPNDVGYFSKQGCLHIIGRSDTLIITGGKKIYPHEIHTALIQTSMIEECYITSIPDDQWGQAIVAFYKIIKGFTKKEIIDLLKKTQPSYMIPKHWILVTEIPLDEKGKPLYPFIDKHLQQLKYKNSH